LLPNTTSAYSAAHIRVYAKQNAIPVVNMYIYEFVRETLVLGGGGS